MNQYKAIAMLVGIGTILLFLAIFLESKYPLNLFYMTVGLIVLVLGFFTKCKNIKLTFSLVIALIGVNVIQWFILLYIYYYNPIYLKTGFYEYLFILIILIITLININHRNSLNTPEKSENKLLEDKTKLILLLTGIIIIIGCLASFIIYLAPIFLYGATLGLMASILGFYYKDKKVNISISFIKAMGFIFILQWIIIIYFTFTRQFSGDDFANISTFSMCFIIYFFAQVSKSDITLFKIFKEEKLIDPDKNTLYTKGKAHQNFQRYQEALKCYNKALGIDSNFKPAQEGKKEVLKLLEK